MIARRPARTTSVKIMTLLMSVTYGSAQVISPGMRTLYSFTGQPDGAYPTGLVAGKNGVLYGVAGGGSGSGTFCAEGCGTIFSLTPSTVPGGAWTESVLYSFTAGSDGYDPSDLVVASSGVLYGSTYFGGIPEYGTVFALTPPASPGGAWTQATLYSFTGGADGGGPIGSLAIGKSGVLYGSTLFAGSLGNGVVFSLKPPTTPGGAWTQTTLYTFAGGADGVGPNGVVMGSGGVLYGTTLAGGTANSGTVFMLKPPTSPGGPWTESVLYSFSGSDGALPKQPRRLAVGVCCTAPPTRAGHGMKAWCSR